MKEPATTTRDVARELARKYSTMTHDELDVLESVLVPMKYRKGDMILNEGEQCMSIMYIEKGLVRQFSHISSGGSFRADSYLSPPEEASRRGGTT